MTTLWITAPHHDEVFCCSAISLWSVSKVRPVNRAQFTSDMNVERCWVLCLFAYSCWDAIVVTLEGLMIAYFTLDCVHVRFYQVMACCL